MRHLAGLVVVYGLFSAVLTWQSRPSDRGEQTCSRPRSTAENHLCESETVMSVDIHPTGHRGDTVAPPAAAKSGPVARIIAGSLAAGVAAALMLTLVVFAGGTESVITGSVLAGFAFGWALIASLTSRYTTRPQRWAVVPAAFMGATGVALLVFAPGYDSMTWLSWVWPPVVLVMAVWMFVQVRRSVTGAGRRMLIPVVAILGLASLGTTYENIVERSDQGTYPAPGKSYQVNGHRLHLDCRGHGGPTVVLSNGLGEISASWVRIADQVDQTTRVCAYDRPGQGWSEETTRPQDGVAAAKDLHTLLAAAGETGPFVLVGHSTGGTYAMTYAARYPEQVAGMVLLDSSSPYQLTKIAAYSGQYVVMRRGLALLPTLARLGLARLAPTPHLPAPAAGQVKALTSTAKATRNGRDEISVAPRVFAQAQALTSLGTRPLAVLTTSESLSGAGWADAQDQLAALSTNRVHRTVDSTHAGLIDDKEPAAQSVRAINEVVFAVRTDTPLEQR
jgi:pimeloyl-ACP methyl ester carboxylesterase